MPELPEVETIRRRLSEVLPGQTITNVHVFHDKSFQGQIPDVVGTKIVSVDRRAKLLRFGLSNHWQLVTHLKMTGQLIYVGKAGRIGGGHPTPDWVAGLPSKHTRIQYDLDDGSQLFFNDQRIFGWMRMLTLDEVETDWAKMGPEIIDPALTAEMLLEKTKRRRIPIKLFLLDTKVVTGLGNIYVCDGLNLAQVSPFKPCNELSLEEMDRVLNACRTVILKGIELGGTTFDGKYVNVDGMAGGYQDVALVYGRSGESCEQCGGLIVKGVLSGRGTYWCEKCQG